MGTRFSNLFFIRIYISLNNFICITNMKFLCISNIFSPWLLDTRIKIIKLIDCWMEAYISLTAPSLVAQCHITHMYWFFFCLFYQLVKFIVLDWIWNHHTYDIVFPQPLDYISLQSFGCACFLCHFCIGCDKL